MLARICKTYRTEDSWFEKNMVQYFMKMNLNTCLFHTICKLNSHLINIDCLKKSQVRKDGRAHAL
jgi:hypothetical protein